LTSVGGKAYDIRDGKEGKRVERTARCEFAIVSNGSDLGHGRSAVYTWSVSTVRTVRTVQRDPFGHLEV
jgi:hypothetical protein